MSTYQYIFAKPYYNVASVANELATEEAWNVYFEPRPGGGFAIRRRPGLSLIHTSPERIGEGLYWSDISKTLYTVQGGNVYYVSVSGADFNLIGSLGSTVHNAVWAEGQLLDLTPLLYVVNGNAIKYVQETTKVLTNPTAFNNEIPTSDFITMMGNRFIANDVNHVQDFRYTDVNPTTVPANQFDPSYWPAAIERTAQKPDALVGIYSAFNEIYLWGTLACEVWQDDGVTPLSPLVGSLIEAGLAAPHSVIQTNNTFFALANINGKRCVINFEGRSPKILSEPIANKLQEYEVVSDAVGSLCFVGGINYYILSFPTENVTWAYDFKTDTWSQWSTWDLALAQHNIFIGRYSAYAKEWNKHLTMSSEGDVYEYSRSVTDDNGVPIRSSVRTGWIDHGTNDRKRCDQIIVKLQGYATTDSKVLFRWRSDGFPEWSNSVQIEVQAGKQNDHFCKLNRMGTYRSRQYEFIMTDACDLALVGLEMDVTNMRF